MTNFDAEYFADEKKEIAESFDRRILNANDDMEREQLLYDKLIFTD
jgi:hypothetical protein